jgi:hypothetical protein
MKIAQKTNIRHPKSRGVSSVGRALQWHCRGQRFESVTLHYLFRTKAPIKPNMENKAPTAQDELFCSLKPKIKSTTPKERKIRQIICLYVTIFEPL